MVSRRPPFPWLLRWPGLVLAGVLVVAYQGSEGSLSALFSADARKTLAEFAKGFWPPAHDSEFLSAMARPLLETVAIAFLGISIAVVLALPLSILATSPRAMSSAGDLPSRMRRASYFASRLTLNLMRSIPELIWALIFVRAIGLGPGAGVLAIGIGYAGVLGKVFAEIFESLPRGPAEALAGSGASPVRVFAFGVLPGAMPMLGSYTLYRFDCALRASAILGLVGAGGLGLQLELSMKMFDYHQVAAQVIALFALVAAADQASQYVRRRLQSSRGWVPSAVPGRLMMFFGWIAALAAAGAFLNLPVGDLFSAQAISSVFSFAASMFPPDLSASFLASLGPAVFETVSVSILGTAIAAVLGLCLAYPAAARVELALAADRPLPWAEGAMLRALAWTSRALLNLSRTLPELLWALILIFVVGLGPFAGALALGVHTAGVLGRLYAEALEEVPRGPLLALRSAGAARGGAFLLALLPQAFPQLVAYTLYRWEVNIRASAVLGVVGAGGLGKALYLSLSLFQHHRTLTLIGITVAMVTAVDLFSGWLRRRVQEGEARAQGPALGEAVELETPGSAHAW